MENKAEQQDIVNDIDSPGQDQDDATVEEEVEETNVEIADGLKKKILTKGKGWQKPPTGAEVTVHYTGTLLDGSQFDSSRDRNEPFVFKLGQGSVIKGWDLGVATMKQGEKCLLTCSPQFAYGTRGSPPKIPPDATLNFEIELISWTALEKVTDDGKVMKKVLSGGDGWKTPVELSSVKVKMALKLKGASAPLHQGTQGLKLSDPELPWGLVEGIKKMKQGQTMLLYVSSDYGYGTVGASDLGVPPNADLEYELTLEEFTNPKETWDMSVAEKAEHGYQLKELGNGVFRKGQYQRAVTYYEAAARLFEYDKDLTAESEPRVRKLQVDCYSNSAACHMHNKDYKAVIKNCANALNLDPMHGRSFFKRAQAFAHLGDHEEALSDLRSLEEIQALRKESCGVDPKTQEKLMTAVKSRIAKIERQQRKIFAGWISKLDITSSTNNNPDSPPLADTKSPSPSPSPSPDLKSPTSDGFTSASPVTPSDSSGDNGGNSSDSGREESPSNSDDNARHGHGHGHGHGHDHPHNHKHNHDNVSEKHFREKPVAEQQTQAQAEDSQAPKRAKLD